MRHPVHALRLLHLVHATGALFGDKRWSVFEYGWFACGKPNAGQVSLVWRNHAAVAVAHHPSSPRAGGVMTDDRPYDVIPGLSVTLRPLADEAQTRACRSDPPTAAAWWTAAKGWHTSDPWSPSWAHGLELLWGAHLSIRGALSAEGGALLRRHRLTAAHGEILRRLLRTGTAGEGELGELSSHPSHRLHSEAIAPFMGALVDLEIELSDPLIASV